MTTEVERGKSDIADGQLFGGFRVERLVFKREHPFFVLGD
jgi:hypothetical protein